MNLFGKLKELNLPKGQYAVFGSGVMQAHALRRGAVEKRTLKT